MTIQNLLLGSTGTEPETAPPQTETGEFAATLTGAMEALAEPPPDQGPPGLVSKTGNEEATPKLPIAVGPAPDLLPETTSPISLAIAPVLTDVELPEVEPSPEGGCPAKDTIGGRPNVGDAACTDDAQTDESPEIDPALASTIAWTTATIQVTVASPYQPSVTALDPTGVGMNPIQESRPVATLDRSQSVPLAQPLVAGTTPLQDWSQPSAPTEVDAQPVTSPPKGLRADALRQALGTQIVSPAVLEFLDPISVEAGPMTAPARPEIPPQIASIPTPKTVAAMPTISIEPGASATAVESPVLDGPQVVARVVTETDPVQPVGSPTAVANPQSGAVATESGEIARRPEAVVNTTGDAPEPTGPMPESPDPVEPQSQPVAPQPKGTRLAAGEQAPIQIDSRSVAVSGQTIESQVAEPAIRATGKAEAMATGTDEPESVADRPEPVVDHKHEATSVSPSSIERPAIRPVGQVRPEEVRIVTHQIADRIERLQEGRSPATVTIHLDPQDLGSVTLTVRSLGRLIDADVSASNEAVRAALEQNRPQLAQAVESRGYTMGSLQFSQAQHQFAGGQSGHEQATRQDFERMANMARTQQSDDRSAPSPTTWAANDQSVDYRI